MTKKKSVSDDLFATISKGVGGELLEDRDKNAWGYIDTGVLGLNYILSGKFVGGGVGKGVCLEIFGNSSSGKSLIGTNIMRGTQTDNGVAVMIDAENTISKAFAVKASHVDPKKFIVIESDTLENAFNRIHKIIRIVRQEAKVPLEQPLFIVYDSIAVSPSEREFKEVDLDMENITAAALKEAGGGAERPGERAKIISKELRKLPPVLSQNNCTILFVNQVRAAIATGFSMGPMETTTSGRGIEFYCSQRLKLSSSKHIKNNAGKVIGINVNVRCIKNKCFMPFSELKALRLFFDKGIDPFSGLLELLLQNERISAVKPAGTYKINEPWAGGQEITFKSSKERNDVPSSVLMKCPKLVDAENSEQVKYYVDMFGSALEATASDIASEEEVKGEE